MKTNYQDLAAKLYEIWTSDLSTEIKDYKEPFRDAIYESGYRFKDEVEEDSPAEGYVLREHGDIEEGFWEHINSEASYDSFRHFCSVLEQYVEPITEATLHAPIRVKELSTSDFLPTKVMQSILSRLGKKAA